MGHVWGHMSSSVIGTIWCILNVAMCQQMVGMVISLLHSPIFFDDPFDGFGAVPAYFAS
jgi:hypothetical protein